MPVYKVITEVVTRTLYEQIVEANSPNAYHQTRYREITEPRLVKGSDHPFDGDTRTVRITEVKAHGSKVAA